MCHLLWSRRSGKRVRAVPGGRRGTVLPLTVPVLLLYPRKRRGKEKGLEKRQMDPGSLEVKGSSPWGCRNTWGGYIHRIVTTFPGEPTSAKVAQKYVKWHFGELHSPNPQRHWRGSAQCTPLTKTPYGLTTISTSTRMTWDKETISCVWQSWEDSWGKLSGWNACGEGLRSKSLSRAKARRARDWEHYLMDETSHPPEWSRRGTNVQGFLRVLIICEMKRKGVEIKRLY